MFLEEGLHAKLLAVGAVTALIGTGDAARLYPLVLPQQGELLFPALTYQRISAPRDSTHDGPEGLVRARVQIDAWARTFAEAKRLADAVRLALDGFKGHAGDVVVDRMYLDGDRDFFEGDAQLYRVTQDWFVWHREAVGR